MLHSISWNQFSTFVLVAAIVYYGWVLFWYYGSDIKTMLTKGRRHSPSLLPMSISAKTGMIDAHPQKKSSGDAESDLFKDFEHVTALLTEAMKKNGNTDKLTRAEIIERSRGILSNYHHLAGTPHETIINDLLLRISKVDLSVNLSLDDFKKIWN